MIYPIGIPAPWVAPDVARPARPSPWTAPIAGYYYVDWATGTDSGRTYGDPTAPRKTIPNPVPAGSYVEVNGTYTGSGDPIRINGAGDSGAWVANTSGPAWVCGLDASNRAAFGNRVLLEGSYLYLDQVNNLGGGNKRWQVSSPTGGAGFTADHILVRNFEIAGPGATATTGGFSISGNSTAHTSNVIVYSGVVHGFGPDEPDIDRDYHGIFAAEDCSYVWGIDCTVYDMAGTGMMTAGHTGDSPTVHHIYYGRNRVYDTWGAGIALKGSNHVVYSQNDVGPIKYTTWTQGKCMGAQYACQNTWFIFNYLRGGDYGIKIASTNAGSTENIYLIGNIIHDIQEFVGGSYGDGTDGFGAAAIGFWGGDNRYVLNNTIYDCVAGVRAPSGTGLRIENNVISESTDEDVQVVLTSTSAVVNNNCIFRTGGNENITFSTTARTVAQFEAAGLGTGNTASDPQMLDPDANIFEIANTSPCISAASPTLVEAVSDTYQAEFSESILFDFDGNVRPFDGSWDIGALEYVGSTYAMNITTLNATTLTVG